MLAGDIRQGQEPRSMGEFFRGWRRTVGCVTLVMACLLAAAWFRSRSEMDRLTFSWGRRTHWLISDQESLGWAAFTNDGRWAFLDLPQDPPHELVIVRQFHMWVDDDLRNWRMRYSTIVLILTLISAGLMLGKSQRRRI